MIKTVEPREEYFIQFTDEEIEQLGWKDTKKLKWSLLEDGTIQVVPYKKIDINLSEFSREILEELIKESCEKDISINQIVENSLKEIILKNKQMKPC